MLIDDLRGFLADYFEVLQTQDMALPSIFTGWAARFDPAPQKLLPRLARLGRL